MRRRARAAEEGVRTRRQAGSDDLVQVHPADARAPTTLRSYLPSEVIYYELVPPRRVRRPTRTRSGCCRVSPLTLTAYLQVVPLGCKGLQIEHAAPEAMAYCAQLQKKSSEVRFKEDFTAGTHLGRANSSFGKAEKRLDKFELKLDQAADSHELDSLGDVVAELPRAADAA